MSDMYISNISDEISAYNFIEDPLYMMSIFSLDAFKILCFWLLIDYYMGFFPAFVVGVCWVSWICRFVSYIKFGKFSAINLQISSAIFSLSSPSETPTKHGLVVLDQELNGVSQVPLHSLFFSIFLFFLSVPQT